MPGALIVRQYVALISAVIAVFIELFRLVHAPWGWTSSG
jgi:hypothetical protein